MSITEAQVFGMGQFWIQDGDLAPPVETWDQSNGLAFPAATGAVILTGEAYGRVTVALDVRTDAPELGDVSSEWDDVVEISVMCEQEALLVCDLNEGFVPGLPALNSQGPGAYRLRVHVRGRDDPALDVDGIPTPADRFLIQCWPAQLKPPLAIRLTDMRGLNSRMSWIQRIP
jgi:hypothetical protein